MEVRKSDPILTLWIGLFSDLFNIEKDCLGWGGKGRERKEKRNPLTYFVPTGI